MSSTECSPRRVAREEFAPIFMPSTARIISPDFRPAFSAGEPETTLETYAPKVESRLFSRAIEASILVYSTPIYARLAEPVSRRVRSIPFTQEIGIAKPIPFPSETAVLIPITSPAAFTSGPPEFPEFIAASV